MSFGLYCVFAIEKGLLSAKQSNYLANLNQASVTASENQNTGTQQDIYTFYCSNNDFNNGLLPAITELMNDNSESCGGIAQADDLGVKEGLFEYGNAEQCGVIVNIEYKW
jgi:hypothetical protein